MNVLENNMLLANPNKDKKDEITTLFKEKTYVSFMRMEVFNAWLISHYGHSYV